MGKATINSLGYTVFPPDEDIFTRFKDDKEKQDFIKKHQLEKYALKKNLKECKWFCKGFTMPPKGALVQIVGFVTRNGFQSVVVEFEDESMCVILPSYFRDMQKNQFKYGTDED